MDENSNKKKQLFWSRKMIEKFIEIYKENECLYDISHQNYNNNRIKVEALKNIVQKMQEYLPNLELYDVQDKIKAIRTQYATEISFIEEAEALGNKYVSNLWCFEQLEFLRKHITPSSTANQIKEENPFCEESNDDAQSEDSDVSLYTEKNNISRNKRPYSRKYRWHRDGLKIFIQMIKKHPILYNPNHKDYGNRDLRCLERNKLLKEMRKVDSQITLNDIRDKMRCLRKQFMKEVRCLKKAHVDNDIYIPKLWCFQRLADLYKDEIDITEFYNSDFKIDESSMSSIHELEYTAVNDNNESFEFEPIHEIVDEVEEEYEVETVTIPTIEITQNNGDMQSTFVNDYHNTIEEDFEYQQPSKKSCTYSENLGNKVNRLTMSNCRTKLGNSKNSINSNEVITYEWLGDLVVSQLGEIAPRYHTEFAWDVQCLIRKYVLKTKTNKNETATSKSPEKTFDTTDQQTSNKSHDLILPKTSNVSFNISFV